MLKNVKVELTNYLGITKTINLEPEQIRILNERFTLKENLKKLKLVCRDYSNNYWVKGYVNGHLLCKFQCNQL